MPHGTPSLLCKKLRRVLQQLGLLQKGKNHIKRTVPNLPKMHFMGFCAGVGQIFTTFAAKFVMYIIKKDEKIQRV